MCIWASGVKCSICGFIKDCMDIGEDKPKYVCYDKCFKRVLSLGYTAANLEHIEGVDWDRKEGA